MEESMEQPLSQGPEGIHPQNLEEQNHWFLSQMFSFACGIAATYGWFILIGTILLLFLRRQLKPQLDQWQEKREQQKEAAEYHKDPDKFIAREQAIQEARLKMQEKYNKLAEEHLQKVKEREEQKRQNTLATPISNRGNASTASCASNTPVTSNKSTKPSLRPAFNPLMDGGGAGWRASRRSGRGG